MYDGVDQEDWEFMCDIFREAADKMGTKKITERTRLLWMRYEMKNAADLRFDKNIKVRGSRTERQW